MCSSFVHVKMLNYEFQNINKNFISYSYKQCQLVKEFQGGNNIFQAVNISLILCNIVHHRKKMLVVEVKNSSRQLQNNSPSVVKKLQKQAPAKGCLKSAISVIGHLTASVVKMKEVCVTQACMHKHKCHVTITSLYAVPGMKNQYTYNALFFCLGNHKGTRDTVK